MKFLFLILTTLTLISPLLISPLTSQTPPIPLPETIDAPQNNPTPPPPFVDQGEDRFMQELVSMATTLGLLIAAMIAVGWILKRLLNKRIEQMNTTSMIKILEKRYLTAKSSIYLLEVNGKGILVGETTAGISKIAEVSLDEENKTTFKEIYEKKT